MHICNCYNLFTSFHSWNQTALQKTTFPIEKCIINICSLTGYASVFLLSLIELVAQAALDCSSAFFSGHLSFTKTFSAVHLPISIGKLISTIVLTGNPDFLFTQTPS